MIPTLAQALDARGYSTLTDVQEAVTAPELDAADLLVSAQTGSGKTVGFGLAIAPTLLGAETRFGPAAAPLALIVAPTRELAMQVARELEWLYAETGARVASCIGGMDARQERRALERGAHVVVGTPGRLRDHITRGALDLDAIRAIVLDEADEMLDLGFREDLEFMLAEAPETKRTLLFSATVPPAIVEIAKRYQRDAVRVSTQSTGRQHADIAYQAIQVAAHDAEAAILNLLRFHDAQTAIVFANTRAAVARLTARLANRGVSVVSLSGELSQDERSHALQALRDGRARVCVATDVAARGIDLPNLELVVHADLPQNTEALLHRSGRTGRAGRKGISALIVPDKAAKKAERLLKWAKITADWIAAPSADDIHARDEARLLADPAWTAAPSEDEVAFAARLSEAFSPEAIAIACLRFYRANLSAPEELNTRPARSEPRAAFGPSSWVTLSVGRAQRAEPRWILPLLCRAGRLDKDQIGKIRVGETETSVEIADAALPGFLAALGADGHLENDIFAAQAGSAPAGGPSPRRAETTRQDRTGPEAKARPVPAKPKAPPRPSEPRSDKEGATKTAPAKPKTARADEKPKAPKAQHRGDAPKRRENPASADRKGARPGKSAGRDAGPSRETAKPASPSPKGANTAHAGKSAGDKPRTALRPGASDPSQPMGKRRKGPRVKARGGDAVPTRKKSGGPGPKGRDRKS